MNADRDYLYDPLFYAAVKETVLRELRQQGWIRREVVRELAAEQAAKWARNP